MPDDDNRALEQLRAALFPARTPTTDDAAPSLVASGEGSNPAATLTPDQLFADWALRVLNPDYRASHPVSLSEL